MRQQHQKTRRLMMRWISMQVISLARSLPLSTKLVCNCHNLHKLIFWIQVQASLQAKVFFSTMCHEEGLTPLEQIKWICTHWGSMYDLIGHMLTNYAVRYTNICNFYLCSLSRAS